MRDVSFCPFDSVYTYGNMNIFFFYSTLKGAMQQFSYFVQIQLEEIPDADDLCNTQSFFTPTQ